MRLWHCAAVFALLTAGLVAGCDEVNVKPSEWPADGSLVIDAGRPDTGPTFGLDAGASDEDTGI